MSTLLKIQSSLFNEQGQSSILANRFAERWLERHPGGKILNRDLARDPLPHLDLPSFKAFQTSPGERTAAQQRIVERSDRLIEELKSADTIVLATPMYNFSVPSVLHAYFDHIARAGVTFRYTADGSEGLIKGKKAHVFVTRGGIYGGDHSQTEFVQQFLGFIGITDVEVTLAEGLAMGDSTRTEALEGAEKAIERVLSAEPA